MEGRSRVKLLDRVLEVRFEIRRVEGLRGNGMVLGDGRPHVRRPLCA